MRKKTQQTLNLLRIKEMTYNKLRKFNSKR